MKGPERAAADLYFCAEGLLLAILPLAFIVPALWRVHSVATGSTPRRAGHAVDGRRHRGRSRVGALAASTPVRSGSRAAVLDIATAVAGCAAAIWSCDRAGARRCFRLLLDGGFQLPGDPGGAQRQPLRAGRGLCTGVEPG